MFWEVELVSQIRLSPQNLHSGIEQTIEDKLKTSVVGQIFPGSGLVLHAEKPKEIGRGLVSSRSGEAIYDVKFKAITFRPFPGQVIDAKVAKATQTGIWAQAGLLDIFIEEKQVPSGFSYECGSSTYQNQTTGMKIVRDSEIRVKIININPHNDSKRLVASGKLDLPHLGLIK